MYLIIFLKREESDCDSNPLHVHEKMIKYVKGDILVSKADAIAHGIAPNDNFKQGLALSLREQWPAMYKDFRHYCKTTHPDEGTSWAWKGVGGPVIVNLFTQEHPKTQDGNPGKASLSYVHRALKKLREDIQAYDLKSVAITKLATGVGGLDWTDVKPLIEDNLSDLDIPIYVYETYEKGTAALEA